MQKNGFKCVAGQWMGQDMVLKHCWSPRGAQELARLWERCGPLCLASGDGSNSPDSHVLVCERSSVGQWELQKEAELLLHKQKCSGPASGAPILWAEWWGRTRENSVCRVQPSILCENLMYHVHSPS